MKFPPSDFESLRKLVILIRQGEIKLHIAKKSLSVLVKMIEYPDIVATSNIVELAQYVESSPATLTRLSKLMGFKGYNYFRQIFKQSAIEKTNYYSHRAQAIVHEHPDSAKQFIQNQLASTVNNINQCLEKTDNKKWDQVVEILAIKRKVFVFGNQQSSALANIFRYGLSLIREDVNILGPAEHGLALAINQIKSRDLLVVFSSAPYSKLSLLVSSLAAKRNCHILAITDTDLSPLHDYARYSINISTEGHYYTNSLAANCVLIESLLSLTASKIGQPAIEKLKQHESLLSKLSVGT